MTVRRITAWRSAKFEEKYKMNNKRKDKAGIATIVGQANYGNRLQNYALDSVLRNLGFDTVTFNDPLQVSFSIKHWAKQEVKRIFGLRMVIGCGAFDSLENGINAICGGRTITGRVIAIM